MSEYVYKQAEKDGVILKIIQDTDSESPREWDNLSKIYCWHGRYSLGDKHDYTQPVDFKKELPKDNSILLPLYLYDHGGLTISTEPFSCPWDSMRLGYVYVSEEAILKEYGSVTDETIEQARKVALEEVNTYDQYLRGEVYGFTLEKKHICPDCGNESFEDINSCWGFYGDDPETNGMKDYISEEYHDLIKELK